MSGVPNPIQDYFVQDASRLVGEVLMLMRVTGRMSALVQKGEAPEGMGLQLSRLSSGTAPPRLILPSGPQYRPTLWVPTRTLCDPVPLECDPANTIYNYQLIQTRLKSNELCMLRRAGRLQLRRAGHGDPRQLQSAHRGRVGTPGIRLPSLRCPVTSSPCAPPWWTTLASPTSAQHCLLRG